ncbi:hypothetical protein ACFU99_17835 [Streptomyces sp. NPDC057654]|uniref:hypothetical protein n=1 Tax=Streptomyces sp. NPDC057654 TaxID=3346196 RepID=UPI00369914E1
MQKRPADEESVPMNVIELRSAVPTFPTVPDRRPRRLGYALVACGLALLPWLCVLATAAHRPAVWVGLDALEALSLIGTGVLTVRRDRHRGAAAGATAMLLVADAWFDVMTAAVGPAFTIALAMALLVELPLAALCVVLAVRASSNAGRA